MSKAGPIWTRKSTCQTRVHRAPNLRCTLLPSTLKNYFPHVLHWCQDKDTPVVCDFFRRWPPLKAAPLARRSALEACCRDHHGRSAEGLPSVSRPSRRPAPSPPMTASCSQCPPGAGPHRPTPGALAGHRDCDAAIAQRAPSHPDFPLFQARPGPGPVFAPRLLVAFGEQRAPYAAAAALQKYAGVAPVTERSGKKAWGH